MSDLFDEGSEDWFFDGKIAEHSRRIALKILVLQRQKDYSCVTAEFRRYALFGFTVISLFLVSAIIRASFEEFLAYSVLLWLGCSALLFKLQMSVGFRARRAELEKLKSQLYNYGYEMTEHGGLKNRYRK